MRAALWHASRACNTRQIWQQQTGFYKIQKKMETKPSSRLSLSASADRSNWESFMAFQLFPLRFNATTQHRSNDCDDSCRTFVSISISSGVFKVLIRDSIFQGYIFRILKRERTLNLCWRTTGRARSLTSSVPHGVVVFVSKLFGEGKKAVPESQVALATCTLYNGQATLLVLVLVLVNSRQHRATLFRGMRCLFVVLRCKQCGTWAWGPSS